MKKITILLTAIALLCCGIAQAQPAALDLSFDPGTGANDWVRTTALQPDGKILIGGDFASYDGTGRNYIARLNADGTLDTSFDPGTGAEDWVQTTAVQPDGKILIGGAFISYNGTGRNRIARLNADGTLDTSFDPGTGADFNINSISLQPDGKIIIGGNFNDYNGTWRSRIARLNANGSLDTSFDPGTGTNDWVWTTALQPNGKIVIGGEFTSYNGTGRSYVARLNANGSLDTSFDPGTGANDWVYTSALQTDGKILIGGDFTSYNGTGRNYNVRINASGTLDTSFDPGTGASGTVRTITMQPDGKILIGGEFTTYSGTGRNRIARLTGNPVGTPEVKKKNGFSVFPNPSDGKFQIQSYKTKVERVEVYDLFGRKVLESKEREIDMRGFAKGMYFVRVGEVVRKLVLH